MSFLVRFSVFFFAFLFLLLLLLLRPFETPQTKQTNKPLTAMLNATQPRAGSASDARIAPRPSPPAAATSDTTDCAASALPAESSVAAAAAAVAALVKAA